MLVHLSQALDDGLKPSAHPQPDLLESFLDTLGEIVNLLTELSESLLRDVRQQSRPCREFADLLADVIETVLSGMSQRVRARREFTDLLANLIETLLRDVCHTLQADLRADRQSGDLIADLSESLLRELRQLTNLLTNLVEPACHHFVLSRHTVRETGRDSVHACCHFMPHAIHSAGEVTQFLVRLPLQVMRDVLAHQCGSLELTKLFHCVERSILRNDLPQFGSHERTPRLAAEG